MEFFPKFILSRVARFYPKILGIFEGDGTLLGIYLFEKNLVINLGNFRNCNVVSFCQYCFVIITWNI